MIMDQDGNYLVRAESIWFFCDTEKMVPVRVMPEDVAAYGKRGDLIWEKAQEDPHSGRIRRKEYLLPLRLIIWIPIIM